MTRRSSAFDDDLAALDELTRLPMPGERGPSSTASAPKHPEPEARDQTRKERQKPDHNGRVAGERGSDAPAKSAPTAGVDVDPGYPAGREGEVAPTGDPAAAQVVSQHIPATTPAGRVDRSEPPSQRRSGNVQTAVRLPREVAKWLTEQSHRQQVTHSSVVVQAVLAHRESLAPELPFGDGLIVRRRPRNDSAPITLRFTPAQLELVDGLAQDFGSTRSALVLAALQAAMGRPSPRS